jgi:integrase
MEDQDTLFTSPARREPWNKGKFTGAKPPLRPKHVWSIRSKLEVEGRTRDLAMFNLAIDSKLRACDVVALKVEDVAPNGYAADLATVRQRKTGQPVRFELTEQTRQAVDEYLRAAGNQRANSRRSCPHSLVRGKSRRKIRGGRHHHPPGRAHPKRDRADPRQRPGHPPHPRRGGRRIYRSE